MADEPHDNGDASQPGNPESNSEGGELSDEYDAVATGFEVDEGEPQDFDAETGEYEAAPDDIDRDDADEEFVLEEGSPEDAVFEPEQPAEAADLEDEVQDDPVDDTELYDGGAHAEEDPADAVPQEDDELAAQPLEEAPAESQLGAEPSDVSAELDDEAAGSDLELEEQPAESSADFDEKSDGDAPAKQTHEGETSDGDDPEQFPLQPELESLLDAPEPESVDVEPLPEVGPYRDPATLTLWVAGDEHETFAVAQDQLVIGDESTLRSDEEAAETDLVPDIDLGAFVDSDDVWGRHAALYRHNKNYTLHVLSDGATQLNHEVLEIGEHRRLEDGDIVVVGGELGLEFNLPEARDVAGQGAPPEADAESADESSDSEAELAVDSADEPEFTDDSSTEEPPEELGADDLLDEQAADEGEQSALGELPDETPPPPGESGGLDEAAAEAPEDADPLSEDDWDDESVDDDLL
jgi:hypothetical protein